MKINYFFAEVIFIKEDLFDTYTRKALMFSYAIFEHPDNIVTPNLFSIIFPLYIS